MHHPADQLLGIGRCLLRKFSLFWRLFLLFVFLRFLFNLVLLWEVGEGRLICKYLGFLPLRRRDRDIKVFHLSLISLIHFQDPILFIFHFHLPQFIRHIWIIMCYGGFLRLYMVVAQLMSVYCLSLLNIRNRFFTKFLIFWIFW